MKQRDSDLAGKHMGPGYDVTCLPPAAGGRGAAAGTAAAWTALGGPSMNASQSAESHERQKRRGQQRRASKPPHPTPLTAAHQKHKQQQRPSTRLGAVCAAPAACWPLQERHKLENFEV